MNASLPTLPLATESAGGLAGTGGNTDLKQLDSSGSQAFGQLLGRAVEAISGDRGAESSPSVQADGLGQGLQTLPQHGKLLPLLQHVLDRVATAVDRPQEVLQRITAKLEGLESNNELNPAKAVVAALYQTLGQGPADEVAAGPGTIPAAALVNQAFQTVQAGAGTPRRSIAQLVQQQPAIADAGQELALNESAKQLKGVSLDKPLGPAHQPMAPEHRQSELATMMAALKRPPIAVKPVHADPALRLDALTAAQVVPSTQTSNPATTGLPTLSVNAPFHQGDWDQAVGERIRWLVSQKMQGAQIKLNPAHLGPMEVRIQVQNDQASIQFASAHTVVREALEAALPKLRDMLDASGVELVDVDVSGQSFAEQQYAAEEQASVARNGATVNENEDPETVMETPLPAVDQSGRLDLFA